jgi:uncharacterized protein YuzE
MRLEFDADSGALYIGVREGRVEQTLDLAEPISVLLWTSMTKAKSLGVELLSLRVHRARNPL